VHGSLIILYLAVLLIRGMRSATVDNDKLTRDVHDDDDDDDDDDDGGGRGLLFFTTRENARWRERRGKRRAGERGRREVVVTPQRDGSREAKISSDDTKAFQSRDLSPSSLCVRVEATFSGMRHSPQVGHVIMEPFPQRVLFMAKLSRGSCAFRLKRSPQVKYQILSRCRHLAISRSPMINGIFRFLPGRMNISGATKLDEDNHRYLIASSLATFCDLPSLIPVWRGDACTSLWKIFAAYICFVAETNINDDLLYAVISLG